jgi:hypothetical protein
MGHVLSETRRGSELPAVTLERLRDLQTRVECVRTEGSAWSGLLRTPLRPLEYDVLACVVAPEVEPRLGWMFQNLQPGAPQPYPTPALLQDLLALDPTQAPELYAVLANGAPLARHHLIAMETDGPYHPVQPGLEVSARLMGWPVGENAPPGTVPVCTRASWDDLILLEDHRAQLREFLYWIQHRKTVVEQWGGNTCGGPIALFAGPSGTGKTFAASVIATDLGWPLYRVDLGLLVSKYIGETEKNLNRLFDAAHGRPMVLQFDEADALFGSRGEVKEARDRYANMEVSHLLARIESHEGPCILTSNLRDHLDPAFARRFQVVVDFPRPDAHARTLLWERLIPPEAPRDANVDPEFLGFAVNLTGGSIRNAALHAAYLAAANGGAIGMKHVTLAVWRELGKDGRELSLADLGNLKPFFLEGEADAVH